jgi:lipid-A-disaccharide synthase
MARSGVRPLADRADFSHAGWQSVLAHAPQLLWRASRYYARAREFSPDLVLAVDAPGLHSPLLNRFRRAGVPCAWVAPPQLWAWKDRHPRVLRGLRVFPLHEFEVDALRDAGADPLWLGYPGPRPSRGAGVRDLLALFPGSRPAWRGRHAELFLEAAKAADTGLQPVFVHPDPPGALELGLPCLAPGEALSRAALALTLPGTAVLEIALQGIAAVVAARPGRFDTWMANRRLSCGPYALPNRILGRTVYPELLGADVGAAEIAHALREARMQADPIALDDFSARLGPEDAAERIVRSVLLAAPPRDR